MIESNKKSFKLTALIFSVILHICVFSSASNNLFKTSKKLNLKPSLNLELVSRFEPKERIVPESNIQESKIAPKTNNLASKNTIVKKEQVKRGFGKAQKRKETKTRNIEKKIEKKVEARAKRKTKTKKNNRDILQQEIKKEGFIKETLKKEPLREKAPKENNALAGFSKFRSGIENKAVNKNNLNSYQPFKYIPPGSSSYLPGVSEGEVTLLNAKANQYAVFVRRVALQVFSSLRAKNWSNVSYQQARTGKRHTVVHAVMDKTGKLVSISPKESSGSNGFDKVVSSAVQTGVWDKNPALSASLDDGNIHFIFKAKTWAEKRGDPPRERRWLLLSTGLK